MSVIEELRQIIDQEAKNKEDWVYLDSKGRKIIDTNEETFENNEE
jgi:hypothetical protein